MKKQNGITLIALVITIIVLLILAGITIAMIAGQDSAPAKAVEARNANKVGEAKDAAALLITGYIQDYYNGKYVGNEAAAKNAENVGAYISAKLANPVTKGEHVFQVDNGTLTVSDTSSNPIVSGTLNPNGTITWNGEATNSGNSGNSGGSSTVTPTGITVSNTDSVTSLEVGETANFTATITPSGATGTIVWSCSPADAVTFSPTTGTSTTATGVTAGNVTITASIQGTEINSSEDEINIIEAEEKISKDENTSYTGKYADIDGNGSIDGIIYVDLLTQAGETSNWGHMDNTNCTSIDNTYTIPNTVTNLNVKDYVISQTSVVDTRFDDTPRDVISPANNSKGTKDRFYVMSLNNIGLHHWYENAQNMSDYAETTSRDFGSGKDNTEAMLAKWNEGSYGTKKNNDLWGEISTSVEEGWFVPSIEEWLAFADTFDLTTNHYYYGIYGMQRYYWSSSLYSSSWACYIEIYMEGPYATSMNNTMYVRLSKTF